MTVLLSGKTVISFARKEGENLNQNWIVENLNNAFSTWNGKLGELWGTGDNRPSKLLRAARCGA